MFPCLEPYKLAPLLNKIPPKLAPKFYGPYKNIQCIGKMAYNSDLLAHSKIHLVFHVSCVKKVLGLNSKVQTNLL